MKKLSLLILSSFIALTCYCQDLTLTLGSGGKANLAFGDTLVGYPKRLTVELQNSGGTDEEVIVSSGNSCFTITPDIVTINSSTNETFSVTFMPKTSATETDTIVFANSISNDTVIVNGTGYYQAETDAGGSIELTDSDNDYIDCGTNIDLANKSFSIDFWFKRSSIGSNDYVIGIGNNETTDMAMHIGFRSSNYFTFAFFGDDINTNTTYTDLNWHHWAVTYDASTNFKTIYRDGVIAGSGTASEDFSNTDGEAFWIGRSYGTNGYADGQVDEVRVWDKVLSQEEILSQYGSLSGNEDDLMAYWRFDEGDGNYVYDITGNGNTGEFINSPERNSSAIQLGVPEITTDLPSSINFGTVAINNSQINTYTIKNTGESILNMDFSENTTAYYINPTFISVPSGDSVTLDICFFPDTTKDYSGAITYSGNAGSGSVTVSGSGLYVSPAETGNSIDFNGTSQYIDLGSHGKFDSLTMDNFSVEMWIKTTDDGRSILIGNYDGNPSFNLEIYNSTDGGLRTYITGADCKDYKSVADGKWHHVASVVNFDANYIHMYIDGILEYGRSYTEAPFVVERNLMLGRDPRSGSHFYDGEMDEVRIWTKALTQEEIRSHYGSLIGNEDDLLAYYRFDESNGNYVKDASGNGLHGLIIDSPTRIPSTAFLGNPELNTDMPDTIKFNEIVIPKIDTATYKVYNTGKGFLNLEFENSESNFDVYPSSISVPGGDSLTVSVNFEPDTSKQYTDKIYYFGNVDGDSIALSGTGVFEVSNDAKNAIHFDGNYDYIYCGSGIELANKSFSIDFWAKRENVDEENFVVNLGTSQSTGKALHIGFTSDNKFTFDFYNDGLYTESSYTDFDWHHWACTYNDETKEKTIYRDGIIVAKGLTSNNFIGSGSFYIGRKYSYGYFDGQIDELRVWEKELTQEEIRSQYTSLSGNEDSLIAYYRFDEDNEDFIFDATGNGHIGYIRDYPYFVTSGVQFGQPKMTSNLPSSIDFGSVTTSLSKSNSYSFVNSGKGILNLDFTNYAAPYYVSPRSIGVLSGDTTTVEFTLIPDTSGVYTDTITYTGNVTGGEIDVNGSAIFKLPEDAGNAMVFDGVDDYIDCGNNPSVQISGTTISLEAWINADSWKTRVYDGSIINKEGDNTGYMLNCGNNGQVQFSLGDGSRYYSISSSSSLSLNTWYHLAGTYDGTTMKLYINGVLDNESTTSLTIQEAGNSLKIGQYYNTSTSRHFDGEIDEVRIWNKALTQEEIRSQYGPLVGNEEGLVAYWRFDEEGSDYVIDASGNDNTGILLNNTSREIPSTAPISAPVYKVISDSLIFSDVPLTTSSNLPIQIINTGGGFLHIEDAFADSSYLSISPATENIFSSDTATFTAQYTPGISGRQTGYFTFKHNTGVDSVYAQGRGIKASSISTVEVVDKFETSISISVDIDSIGDPNTGYGLCWNTTGTPTTADNIFDNGPAVAKGLDTLSMTGLEPAITYFVRAFISNGSYVTYGSEIEVKTYGVPELNSVTISNITDSTANCNFKIVNKGNPALTNYGICWATSTEPSVLDNKKQVDVAADTGSYTLSIKELALGSTYYVRAYAINSADTAYSEEVSFIADNAVLSAPDTVKINVPIAATGSKEFTISNEGDVAMNIYSISSDLDYFSGNAINSNIEAGESEKIRVNYTAPDTEAIYGNIIITSNAGSDTILVEGTAYQQAAEDAKNALEFDGANDFISANHINLYNTSFSIECWVKRENTGSNSYFISQGENNPNEVIHFGFSSTNVLRFGFGDDNLSTSTTHTDNEWHHYACTYDIYNKLMSVYCDGELEGTKTASAGYTYTGEAPFLIGTYLNSSYFEGHVDELRVWTKALTQTEIRSQYGSLVGNEDGLYAYWRFDESESDSIFDATGNHNSGILVNGTSREINSTAPVGEPELTFAQDSLDFGTIVNGNVKLQTFKVINSGGGFLHVDSIGIDTAAFEFPFFMRDPIPEAIISKDTAELLILFNPDSAEYYTDYFVFEHNVGTDSIFAQGYYVELPTIQSIAIDEAKGTSADLTVTIDPVGSPSPQHYGLCWNTTGLTSLDDEHTDGGILSSTGTYTLTSTGLKPLTTYHIRFYVITGSIVTYSDEITFTTIKQTPVINWEVPASITYGTPLSNEQLNATVDVNGTLEFSPVAGTIFNVGDNQELSVTFTPEYPDSVYGGSATVSINVTKASLTITADNANRSYGEENPEFTFSYNGFVNDEDKSVLDTEPTVSCGVTATSDAGTYEIVAAGGKDENYDFVYQSGTLVIEKATLTVIAENATRVYGEENPEFTVSYSGFVNNEDESVLGTEPTATSEATATSDVGTYGILAADGEDINYNFTYQPGTLTVNKAHLAVGVTNESITEGSDIPEFTLTYTGFVNNETESVLDTRPTASTDATPASAVGSYDVVVSGGSDNNYEMSYTNGTLTITPLTSVDDETFANVSVYPNPVSSIMTIQLNGADLPANYKITSATGKALLIGELVNEKNRINLEELRQGVYILTIYNEKSSTSYSLIKE